MTQTVYGIALDPLGHARNETRVWSTPSTSLRSVQNEKIPVTREHRDQVGELVYAERRDGNIWLVAEIDDTIRPEVQVRVADKTVAVPHDLYWSVSRIGDAEIGYLLTEVALTASPARITARPVEFRQGDAHMAAYRSSDSHERRLLERAHQYDLRRHGNPIVVQGDRPQLAGLETRGAGLVEVRSASAIDVRQGQREVTLLIAPAEVPARIFERGKSFSERFAHGCFAESEQAPEKVKLNRDHVIARTIGRALEIDAWSELGCVGTFKISKVAEGDEALELLADGVAAASAGFEVLDDEWRSNSERRIRKGRLHHVAVTADPAHQTSVLGIRSGEFAGVD